MKYESILNLKPNKINKTAFCSRIVSLIEKITIRKKEYMIPITGIKAFETMFLMFEGNSGYSSLEDILVEKYGFDGHSIFEITKTGNDINNYVLLSNIEIVINVLYSSYSSTIFLFGEESHQYIDLILKASQSFLYSMGYEYKEDKDKLIILPTKLSVNFDKVDKETKEEIMNYFHFLSINDITKKSKIITEFYKTNFDGYKNEYKNKFGDKYLSVINNYLNNFNLRHDNVTPESKHFKESIAELTTDELIEWYDFIFQLLVNAHSNIKTIMPVNIDRNYKSLKPKSKINEKFKSQGENKI